MSTLLTPGSEDPHPPRRRLPPCRRDPATEASFRAALRRMREAALEAAACLVQLDACRHWLASGCASLAEFGERNGASAAETRTLFRLGQGVAARPDLREEVVSGGLSVPSLAALRDVLLDPSLAVPGEDFVALARAVSTTRLQQAVRRRLAERREGGRVTEVTVHLSGRGRDDLLRARRIASRKAERPLSFSETVQRALDAYLAQHDPRRRRRGLRRLPPTAGLRGRPVPAEVDRALDERHAGRCAVPRCDHDVWTERAHVVPRAQGGDQELGNLVLLCRRHHDMLDQGRIRITGPPGQRRFETDTGEDLGPLDPPAAPG